MMKMPATVSDNEANSKKLHRLMELDKANMRDAAIISALEHKNRQKRLNSSMFTKQTSSKYSSSTCSHYDASSSTFSQLDSEGREKYEREERKKREEFRQLPNLE